MRQKRSYLKIYQTRKPFCIRKFILNQINSLCLSVSLVLEIIIVCRPLLKVNNLCVLKFFYCRSGVFVASTSNFFLDMHGQQQDTSLEFWPKIGYKNFEFQSFFLHTMPREGLRKAQGTYALKKTRRKGSCQLLEHQQC